MLVRTEKCICPKCGGHLCWGEWTGIIGARVKATCVNHFLRSSFFDNRKQGCDFEAIAIRQSTKKMIYEYEILMSVDQLNLLLGDQ